MMKWVMIFATFGLLSACGVDGEPQAPTLNPSVSITPSGVRLGSGLGFGLGAIPVRVGLGLNL